MRRLLLMLIAAVLLTGCSLGAVGGGKSHASVGSTFDLVGPVEGRPVSFVLPTGRWDFVVSEPRATARHALEMQAEDLSEEAGDDAEFIDIGFEGLSALTTRRPPVLRTDHMPTFTLVAGDTSINVTDVGSRLVTVPKDAEVSLVATFDDRQVTLDPYDTLRGPYAGDVYEGNMPRMNEVTCPRARNIKVPGGARFGNAECRVRISDLLPWVQFPTGFINRDDGWAPDGKRYVNVDVSIDINTYFSQTINGEYIERETGYGEPTYTLNGAKPVVMLDGDGEQIDERPTDMEVYDVRSLVFQVPEDTKKLTMKFALTYTGTPEHADESDAGDVGYTFRRRLSLNL